MSYCVNCGVELEKSLAKCPLCGVEVQNPSAPANDNFVKPYPSNMNYLISKVDRRLIINIASVIMFLLCAVNVIADTIYSNGISWSIYAVSALCLIWMFTILPLMAPGWSPLAFVLIDTAALLAFLYVIAILNNGTGWYLSLALPIVVLVGGITLINIAIGRSHRYSLFTNSAILMVSAGVGILPIEVILDLYAGQGIHFQWAWFVAAPCFAIALIIALIKQSRRTKDQIKRRLHIK